MFTKVNPRWRSKILADVAWRQRLERYCVKVKLCPNFKSFAFDIPKESSRHDQHDQIEGKARPQPRVFVSKISAQISSKRQLKSSSELRFLK